MNQSEAIRAIIAGRVSAVNQSALTASKNAEIVNVYTYAVTLATIDTKQKIARLNVRRYSATSSKHRGVVRRALENAGYTIETYEGESRWGGACDISRWY